MNAADLRAALDRLGLSMAAAARRWGIPYRTLQNWCLDPPKDGELPNGARKPAPILDHLIALEEGATKPLKDSR